MGVPEASIDSLFRHSPEPQSDRGRYKMRRPPFGQLVKEWLFGPQIPEWPDRQMTDEEFTAVHGREPRDQVQAISLYDMEHPSSNEPSVE